MTNVTARPITKQQQTRPSHNKSNQLRHNQTDIKPHQIIQNQPNHTKITPCNIDYHQKPCTNYATPKDTKPYEKDTKPHQKQTHSELTRPDENHIKSFKTKSHQNYTIKLRLPQKNNVQITPNNTKIYQTTPKQNPLRAY